MRQFALAIFGVAALSMSSALAAEKTVTLAVQNMYCAACPHTVRASLQAVPGVRQVSISLAEHTAVVTYDDAVTNQKALTTATTNAGYPSSPKS